MRTSMDFSINKERDRERERGAGFMDCYRMLRFVIAYLSISLVASLYSVEGIISTLTNEENLELDRELSSLNKPAVKTIKTNYGDVYDCVDIYKQPALDHPLLNGHKIQMKPSFGSPSTSARNGGPSLAGIPMKIGLKEGCPTGTIPIRRTTKKELLRAKSSFRQRFQDSNVLAGSGFEFAGISTVPNNNNKYYGAGGDVGIYNPTADHGQFSASVISVEDGPLDQFSTIRFGWMVNVNLFGDNRTRLYTLWGQGVNGSMHGCFNTYCPGFVHLNPRIPLGLAFAYISSVGGPQFYVKLTVFQDKKTGDWLLTFSQNVNENDEVIGYWPNSLFTNLKSGAEIIRWGGMVYSDTPSLPPMGSGDSRNCHFRHLYSLIDEAWSWLNGTNVPTLETSESQCYKVGDNSYKDDFWGYSFWFGGDGGDHCN